MPTIPQTHPTATATPSLPSPLGGPRTEHGKRKIRFNAVTHGLTSQVACMPWEDRAAFDRFCSEMVAAYHPDDILETQLAQAIAEDRWRLNRARVLEQNYFAIGMLEAAPGKYSDDPAMDAALIQAATFFADPNAFARLTLYEQRINRSIRNNEAALAERKTARRLALEQALEEAELLSLIEGLPTSEASPILAQGFVFASSQIGALLDRKHRLDAARKHQNSPSSLRMAA